MPKVARSRSKQRREQIVPYVRGFKPPNERLQLQAAGFDTAARIPPEYSFDGFSPIKKCTSIDDWLAQYREDGQTYDEFLQQCPWLSRRKVKYMKQRFVPDGITLPLKYPDGKVYIMPLGDFSNAELRQLDDLMEYTEIFLGLPVRQMDRMRLEVKDKSMCFHHHPSDVYRVHTKTTEQLKCRFKTHGGATHHQISIADALQILQRYLPDDALCMIALTRHDLYEASSDLFVAGMAAGNRRVAIFSLYRYNPNLEFSQEFWYDVTETQPQSDEEAKRKELQRGCRLLVHEIAHLLGIAHCVYFDCCMNGSGHLQEDFQQPMHFCPVDLRKLQTLVGFDVRERYALLRQFYAKHRMVAEERWVTERLKLLTKDY